MLLDLIAILFKVIPLFLLFFLFKNLYNYKIYNYINYIYLFKFIIFSIFLIIYYTFYILIYVIYFTFKNFRFFKYYYVNMNTAFFYYKKKSIYFLFWRFLVHKLFFLFLFNLYYTWNKIKKIFKALIMINNFYLLFIIFFKIKITNKNLLIKIYDGYVYFIYHLFYFINIDEVFNIIKAFNLNILNLLKFVKDPILNRNNNFTWFSYSTFLNYKNLKKNSIFIIKNSWIKLFISTFMYQIYKIYISCNIQNLAVFYKLLSNMIVFNKLNLNKLNLLNKLKKILNLLLYFFNLFFINLLYYIILYFTYIIYISLNFITKFKYIIISIIVLLICIKYYWIFYYFFYLLYKHYLLYIPLFQVKESTRFFNFEWIDLRNYFNLIFLHNTLVDLTVFNNVIYNDLLNNLNKTLSVYGFKVGNQYDINLYSMLKIYNKDTLFLDGLLNKFNKSNSASLWKWYNRLKKLYTNKAQMLFRFNKYKYKNSKFYHKSFEKSIRHNSVKQEGVTYLGLNRENFFKHNYKPNLIIWKLYNKTYFKKVTHNYVSLNISNFKKIKKIPLKYIYLYNTNNYIIYRKKIFNILNKYLTNAYIYKKVKKYSVYYLRKFYKIYKKTNYLFFFNRLYNFEHYKNKMQMKHKIPTFEWTSLRWRRKTPNHLYFNASHLITLEEHQKWYSFFELAKKKTKKKRVHWVHYINYKYPFSLNKNKNIIESLSYLKHLDSYIKIIKKYYYIKNTKIYFMKRFYKRLLHSNSLILKTYIYRLKNWNDPFFKKQLSNKNNKTKDLNFWYFFDYLKVDKYYFTKHEAIYQEESDLTLYFIKKTRKDYIKLRNHLLRMYSLFFHYYYLERAVFKQYLPSLVKKTKVTKASVQLKNKRILWNYESFKINWMLKIYLTRQKVNRVNFKNINIISKLFKQHFFAYFIYCDYTINSYNELYYIKIKSYSLKVLNKINNLKRFFYFQNNYTTGWSFFKYLNSFSLTYHIKHLLWNSPYSFLFLQENLSDIDINYINNNINIINLVYVIKQQQNFTFLEMLMHFRLKKEDIIINIHNYSMLFNLYLNVVELNNNWYDANQNLDNNIYLTSFLFYYNCGYSKTKQFYFVDTFRFITNFIFEYYTNFLYRLTRYRYILNYKNYTFYDFIKRYFNFETKLNFYFKIRVLANDLKFINRFYKYILNSKNKYTHNAYKKKIAPFWFIFDYYIKLFIYFLLKKYYVKELFIYYWIYKFKNNLLLNCNVIFIAIFYYNFKLLFLNFFLINYNFKTYIFTFNYNINIYHYYSLLYWYLSLIFQLNINYIILLDIVKIKFMVKLIWLKWIQIDLYKYNLNKIIFIKLYFEKLIIYYIKIYFNIKNNYIFFKPNYIFYRKQRFYRVLNRTYLHNIIFKNSVTYRSKNSFKHLTNNILFFKNIYLTNIYNYVYLFNISNINIGNYIDLFFYLFKYNYAYLNIVIFILLYWFIFLLLFIFYKKFYNIFFFCNFENFNSEYNWNQIFQNKVIRLVKKVNRKNYKFLTNKKLTDFNNFNFNNFFKKLSFKNYIKKKILFITTKRYNEKFYNNNNVIAIPNKFKLLISPYTYLHAYIFNLFINITKMPIKLKKENKFYNFYFHDILNSNLFNFCIFYWLLLIPYFFFEYILMKYHLRGHVLIKRRMFLILKIFLDNFKWFIKLFKIIGEGVNLIFKHRHPKTSKGIHSIRNKKKLKFGYFFKWDRMHKQRLHISPLGSYYYWFFRINKIEYFFSVKKYYLNNIFKSNYFYYIYIFFILLYIIIKRYFVKQKLNFIFIKMKWLIS